MANRLDREVSSTAEAAGGPASRSCVLVFTKPPRPGKVKTRLIGDLSAAEAARLHAAFLADVLEALGRGRFAVRIAWALEPGEDLPGVEVLPGAEAAAGVAGLRQEGADLGERLYDALRRTAAEFERVAAVGSDHPEIDAAVVEEAFRRLRAGGQVVLGPVDDGGYYLIALDRTALAPELFEGVAWSTGAVLEETLARCRKLGLRVEMLAPGHDVDVASDLERLVERLPRGGDRCPRTRALLAQWGRLPDTDDEALKR